MWIELINPIVTGAGVFHKADSKVFWEDKADAKRMISRGIARETTKPEAK